MKVNKIAAAVISAGLVFASSWSVSAAEVVLDLTTVNSIGVINGAYFANPAELENVGTGVLDPFLSIQMKGSESGFNTDASPLPLDTKRPNFTDAITVSQIGTFIGVAGFGVTGATYRQFFLDINEPDNSKDNYLSFNQLKIGFGTVGDLTTFPTTAWDMDAGNTSGEDNRVLLDYHAVGSGSGKGYDLTFLIPETVFASRSSGNDFVYLFAEFGTTGKVGTRDYGSESGFEEFWALRAVPVDCPPGSTDPACITPPQEIPEPGTLALVGLALLGGAAIRRRKV